MNQTQTRSLRKKVLSLILAVVMAVSLLPISAFASGDSKASSDTADSSYEYNIMFLDCGRKYYSVDSIKQIIDNASAAGFNYIQLAVGNDGLRFLLDDMSLTVNGTTYDSDKVSAAIHAGNEAYYNFGVDELTQSEMDTIIAYAASKGMGVIPCVNTPGHMDAILDAAEELTGKTCSYNGSARTIDVTNSTAVAFTQALLQKYINYFAGKGCKLFNMGADEYANDKYTSGSMGFGNLQSEGNYSYYVKYVNAVDEMIQAAGMTAMAFNDGIYFQNDTSDGTFNNDILVCYWSSGWNGYTPMSASNLASKGFKLINTNGDYYWVLGKTDAQCSASKASGFNVNTFQGSTISDPAGSMFCIWADYPGAETEASVISKTAATIAAFGAKLPTIKSEETVTKGDVTVTAPGLTGLTVTETAAPAIDAAAEGKVVAYDVTPATASGNYEKSGTVTLPIPAGWDASRVRGFVQNEDGTITTVSGTPADGKFTFTVPHFSVLGIYELAANAVDKTEDVTVAQGSESEAYLLSGNVTLADDTYTTDDGVASYTIKTTTEKTSSTATAANSIESGGTYIIGNGTQWLARNGSQITSVTNKDSATKWTITSNGNSYYYITDGTYYLRHNSNNLSANTNGSNATWQWSKNSGFYYYSSNNKTYYLNYNNDWQVSRNSSQGDGQPYVLTAGKTITVRTVVFTGLEIGTTPVIIGDTRYNVKVVSAALANAKVTVEYWITNREVTANGAKSIEITAADGTVNSATGAKLSDLVPASGIGRESDAEVVFWKGTRLDSGNKQTADMGNDKTKAGTDFTYIRYWNSQWSFSANGTDWSNFESGDQIVAYYLQKTDVTTEVTTEVADWGPKRTEYNSSNFVLLDYAVKYESGDRSPNTFPVDNKTLAFHCNTSSPDLNNTVFADGSTYYRKIGTIRAEETAAGYEVYMITVTPTSDTKTDSVAQSPVAAREYAYKGTEKVVWVDKTDDLGDFADTSKQYEGFSVGGDAVVPGLKIYNQQGMLVTYYVRAKTMPGSLTVRYVDKTTGDEFHSYGINVTNTVENQTLFKENIGLADPWKGPLANGDVVNNVGVKQWVNADLSTMPSIPTKYRYAMEYTCVDVVRSADGKEVTLYYTFKMDKTFVVDFGLPLVIQPTDISANLESAKLTGVTANSSTQQDYADITSDANYNITYKLKTMLNGADKLDVKYNGQITVDDGTQTGSVSYEVGIIPASTVYYEDNFVEFSDGWKYATTADQNAVQDLDELTAQKTYGYDSHYRTSNEFSLGNAMMTTVSSATNSNPPTATFTFKGTGFDLVSMTSKDTGTILVNVVGKDSAGNDVTKNWIVDTFYGYTRTQNGYIQYTWTKGEDGKWHNKAETITALPAGATIGGTPVNSGDVTYELNYIWTPVTDQSNALYQIPVIHYTDLPYGAYTVTITPKYSSARDPYYTASGDSNSYDFYLDGVRIYNPAGDKLNDQYVQDGEGYAQFTEIRNMLIAAKDLKLDTSASGVVFVDGVGDTSSIEDYTNYGPNNEVYLSKGQAIAFKISDMSNVDTIQIGAKAPSGNTTMQIEVDGNDVQTQELTTASDMYYKLDNVAANKTVVITNAGDNLLSLTTLKVTYKTTPTATNSAEAIVDSDVLAQAPVMLTSMLYGEPQTFEPSRFEASWGHSVRKGDTATLTVKASEDTAYITVDGKTVTNSALRTERTGWGWWAKTVTYREFTYTMTADATVTSTIYAFNDAGVSSDAITATLTVRPSVRDWLHGIIGKWF